MIRQARRALARIFIPLFHLLPIAKGAALKVLVMRLHGADAAWSAQPSPGLFMQDGFNVRVGERTSLGVGCIIAGAAPVVIGTDCPIAAGVKVIADGDVTIGNHVWIGAGAVVTGPCTIGNYSIVGAKSSVSGDVPPGSRCVGSPARILRPQAPA
jgi:acetyltransferase-like isoleucine patch superfamily enzyme